MASATTGQDLRATLARVERTLIERALRASGGNLSAAGRALGIERNLLRYKLRKHGLRL
jgi:DNA-binding NtrC family response regulator